MQNNEERTLIIGPNSDFYFTQFALALVIFWKYVDLFGALLLRCSSFFMFCCWCSLVCLFSVSLPWTQNRNQVIHGMRRTRTQEHAVPVICLWSERISGVCERRRWSTARRCQVQCGRTILHWACCRGGRSKDKYVLFLSLSVLLFLPIIRSVYFPRPSISVRATP